MSWVDSRLPTNVASGLPAAGGLLGGLPAAGGLLGGLGALTSALPALPAPTGGLLGGLGALTSALPASTGLLTPPKSTVPRIILSGTIVDKAYNWAFYNNGAVQVELNFLFPRQGILSGLLPDRTFVGLFADGLHIGVHVVSYPTSYLPLLTGVKLLLPPPSLLSSVPDDDDSDTGKR
ncbi:hypothetical protein EJ07DRAFT_184244 [Lizonia empirigonia]|nr:hypothetical protein EJ07DRAFT_184244 [Lizonia empirigonia]